MTRMIRTIPAWRTIGPIGTPTISRKKNPKILALHASSHRTSNTYALWSAVKEKLLQEEEGRENPDIREIGLRNGTLYDCSGCSFNACRHFGEQESCFYGGVIVEDVYPAVREADAVVMICPETMACSDFMQAPWRKASNVTVSYGLWLEVDLIALPSR